MSKQLRYYQLEAKEAVNIALQSNITKQLIVMATGTGKTKLAVEIVKPMGRTLWITHSMELIIQSAIAILSEELNVEKEDLEYEIDIRGGLINILKRPALAPFTSDIKNNIGVIKEDLLQINSRVSVASIQTLWRRLDQIPPDTFDVIVCDEAHRTGAKSWLNCIEHFKPKLLLGLTATPFRALDGMQLDDIFDKIVYEYPIEKGITDGFLCEIDGIQIKTSVNIDSVKTIAGDLNQKDLTEKVNTLERNNLIVSKYIEYAQGRKFIAFCCDVQHTVDLCEAFNEKGIKSNFIVGDETLTLDRGGSVKDFKRNPDVFGLVNCMIATEGFDFPDAGCIILATPTKSKTKFLQQLGRGTRLKSSSFVEKFGQNVIILDITDNTSKHKLINTHELDKELPIEERIFLSRKNKDKLLKAKQDRMMAVANREKDVKAKLYELPKIRLIFSQKYSEPATEGQLKVIERLGFDVVNNSYNKFQCAQIIGDQPASQEEVNNLISAGYNVSRGVTRTEALKAYQQITIRDAKANAIKYKNR